MTSQTWGIEVRVPTAGVDVLEFVGPPLTFCVCAVHSPGRGGTEKWTKYSRRPFKEFYLNFT